MSFYNYVHQLENLIMSPIVWSIPGAYPEDCLNPAKLFLKGGDGMKINTSHLIVSYRFFDDELAEEIARTLPSKQGDIFRQLRRVDPTDFQRQSWRQKLLFQPKPQVTWLQYAERLGYDMDSFWNAYEGANHEIEMFLRRRAA